MLTIRVSRLRLGCDLSVAACGVVLALTLQMYWVSYGQGSTLVGSDLASALRRTPASERPWTFEAALGLYAVAALGCGAVVSAFARRRRVIMIRACIGVLPAVVLVVLSVDGAFPMRHWNVGAVSSFVGSLLIAGFSILRSTLVSKAER